MALTGHEAQHRHRWHQNKLSLAPESLSPDSQHLKWTFNYLEVLLGGKFLTGQEPEKKEADRGENSNPPISAWRDTARPYPTRRSIADMYTHTFFNVCGKQPFQVHYLCSELYGFPADTGSTLNL